MNEVKFSKFKYLQEKVNELLYIENFKSQLKEADNLKIIAYASGEPDIYDFKCSLNSKDTFKANIFNKTKAAILLELNKEQDSLSEEVSSFFKKQEVKNEQ